MAAPMLQNNFFLPFLPADKEVFTITFIEPDEEEPMNNLEPRNDFQKRFETLKSDLQTLCLDYALSYDATSFLLKALRRYGLKKLPESLVELLTGQPEEEAALVEITEDSALPNETNFDSSAVSLAELPELPVDLPLSTPEKFLQLDGWVRESPLNFEAFLAKIRHHSAIFDVLDAICYRDLTVHFTWKFCSNTPERIELASTLIVWKAIKELYLNQSGGWTEQSLTDEICLWYKRRQRSFRMKIYRQSLLNEKNNSQSLSESLSQGLWTEMNNPSPVTIYDPLPVRKSPSPVRSYTPSLEEITNYALEFPIRDLKELEIVECWINVQEANFWTLVEKLQAIGDIDDILASAFSFEMTMDICYKNQDHRFPKRKIYNMRIFSHALPKAIEDYRISGEEFEQKLRTWILRGRGRLRMRQIRSAKRKNKK